MSLRSLRGFDAPPPPRHKGVVPGHASSGAGKDDLHVAPKKKNDDAKHKNRKQKMCPGEMILCL